MAFVHLHTHSHYSILKGIAKPKDLVKKAKELWMTSIALTDIWVVHWIHELYWACKSEGINIIAWIEIFITNSDIKNMTRQSVRHPIILLAKNIDWYRNILSLVTASNMESDGGAPVIDFDILRQYSDNLICLSWPVWSEISFMILSWLEKDKIYEKIKVYQEIFWEDDFYLQIEPHKDIAKQDLVNQITIDIHKEYWVNIVASSSVFYIEKEDKNIQDVVNCLWTWHEIDNPDRESLIAWDYSFLSENEMQAEFWFIPQALENTNKIADKINLEFETWWVLIPKYDLPEEHQKIYEEAMALEKDDEFIKKLSSDEWYLRYLCFEWLNWRYDYNIDKQTIFELVKKLDKPSLDKKLQETSPEELKDLSLTYYTDKKKELLKEFNEDVNHKIERLEYELVVVHEMWFDWYFLIVADYINYARKIWVPVWPWRGSAAWALLAYLSWITDIDPLKYDLLFERFLNPARVSMPDIDTDFSDDWRWEVIEYCRNKYWADHVAQICTFGTFAARAAVKDVWRVMWVWFAEMNDLAKLIPEKPWTKLAKALEESIEFKNTYDTNSKHRKIIDTALKIEWNVRQLWVHACAVIIAPSKMTNYTALQHPPKDNEAIVTQYSAYPLEDLGLLKMDFLWLKNLTIIKKTQEIVKESKWKDIDVLDLNMEDQNVFKIFADWNTTWVFQFESDWMRKYLKDLWPNTFEDIIVMVSLYRPWPLQYIPTYINRKHWLETVEYPHSSLEKILSPTQWIAVYQEQIMQMVQAFAWFSLWWADILRRAIWKKKIDVLMEQKKIFVEESVKQWHSEKLALHIFEDVIEPFAWYWFNKSHAACYAFISYQTAYLKAYYPTEFLTAVMCSDEENMERIVLEVWEARASWINVSPPAVNNSDKHFTYISDSEIRFWLKAIKWIWEGPIDAILFARESWAFSNLEDFVERCWKEVINKRTLESLILSWAMDELWERWEMLWNIDNMVAFLKWKDISKETNQIGLFDMWWDEFEDKLVLDKKDAFRYEEKLAWEKEYLWFTVSWHYLDWIKDFVYKTRIKWADNPLKKSFEYYTAQENELNKEIDEKRKKQEEEIKNSWWSIEELKEIKRKKLPKEKVYWVWVVVEKRSLTTKTWKKMMIARCESFWFDFELMLYDKDFDTYEKKIKEDYIVFIDWFLSINTEYKRKTVSPWKWDSIICTSVSNVRQQALNKWLFNDYKYNRFVEEAETEKFNESWVSDKNLDNNTEDKNVNSYKKEGFNTSDNPKKLDNISYGNKVDNVDNSVDNSESWIDASISYTPKKDDIIGDSWSVEVWQNMSTSKEDEEINEFFVDIPSIAKKEDLPDFKNLLLSLSSWKIRIYISLKWQKIDTKISISDLSSLKKWIENKWW